MTIKFACPQCGANLRAPDSTAGHRGKCNKCGAFLRVPTSAETVSDGSALAAPDVDALAKASTVRPSASFGPVIGPLIAGLLFCLVVGVAIIGFVEFQRYRRSYEVQRANQEPALKTHSSQNNVARSHDTPLKAQLVKVDRQNIAPPASKSANVDSPTPRPVVSTPPDPQVAEFRQHMLTFLKEAQALVRYCHEDTSFTKYATKLDVLIDVFTHIPEPPRGYEQLHKRVQYIKQDFDIERLERKWDDERLEMVRNADRDTKATDDKVFARSDAFVQSEKIKLDQLEKDLMEHR